MISKTSDGAVTPAVHTVPATITVRVVGQAVGENNRAYLKGETFDTTPERRAALGALVDEV